MRVVYYAACLVLLAASVCAVEETELIELGESSTVGTPKTLAQAVMRIGELKAQLKVGAEKGRHRRACDVGEAVMKLGTRGTAPKEMGESASESERESLKVFFGGMGNQAAPFVMKVMAPLIMQSMPHHWKQFMLHATRNLLTKKPKEYIAKVVKAQAAKNERKCGEQLLQSPNIKQMSESFQEDFPNAADDIISGHADAANKRMHDMSIDYFETAADKVVQTESAQSFGPNVAPHVRQFIMKLMTLASGKKEEAKAEQKKEADSADDDDGDDADGNNELDDELGETQQVKGKTKKRRSRVSRVIEQHVLSLLDIGDAVRTKSRTHKGKSAGNSATQSAATQNLNSKTANIKPGASMTDCFRPTTAGPTECDALKTQALCDAKKNFVGIKMCRWDPARAAGKTGAAGAAAAAGGGAVAAAAAAAKKPPEAKVKPPAAVAAVAATANASTTPAVPAKKTYVPKGFGPVFFDTVLKFLGAVTPTLLDDLSMGIPPKDPAANGAVALKSTLNQLMRDVIASVEVYPPKLEARKGLVELLITSFNDFHKKHGALANALHHRVLMAKLRRALDKMPEEVQDVLEKPLVFLTKSDYAGATAVLPAVIAGYGVKTFEKVAKDIEGDLSITAGPVFYAATKTFVDFFKPKDDAVPTVDVAHEMILLGVKVVFGVMPGLIDDFIGKLPSRLQKEKGPLKDSMMMIVQRLKSVLMEMDTKWNEEGRKEMAQAITFAFYDLAIRMEQINDAKPSGKKKEPAPSAEDAVEKAKNEAKKVDQDVKKEEAGKEVKVEKKKVEPTAPGDGGKSLKKPKTEKEEDDEKEEAKTTAAAAATPAPSERISKKGKKRGSGGVTGAGSFGKTPPVPGASMTPCFRPTRPNPSDCDAPEN